MMGKQTHSVAAFALTGAVLAELGRLRHLQLAEAALTAAVLAQAAGIIHSWLKAALTAAVLMKLGCLRHLQLAEEAGEWMMEGASHGIASTDCFELFGFPEDAPNLRDPDSPGTSVSAGLYRGQLCCIYTGCLLPAT